MNRQIAIPIGEFDYGLPPERIARYPLAERDASKLLVYRGGEIVESRFSALPELLPPGSLLVFNNTKVIRARIVFFKETGARIEIFCLEPHEPADHERAFAQKNACSWRCMTGNAKKWKDETLSVAFTNDGKSGRLNARKIGSEGSGTIVHFDWDADLSFGQLLDLLGDIPIPPYLCRRSEAIDNSRYQTVYSRFEGSVAAPTAGLHFTEAVLDGIRARGIVSEEVTLHVGAGTFLPVKGADAARHEMHTEYFEVGAQTVERLLTCAGRIVAVGTTSVRTLESLAVLGWRVMQRGTPEAGRPVGQWEAYDIPPSLTGKELLSALAGYLRREGSPRLQAATRVMITPSGFRFRVVQGMVTNFHQPRSTLLLLVSAFVGGDWRRIYDFALAHDFRFLSYGDSSLLLR